MSNCKTPSSISSVRPYKTLWDWLELLIVPAALAIGGFMLTRSESRATATAVEQRSQEETIQAYLDQMSQVMLERGLRSSDVSADVRTLARARTLATLERLGSARKAYLLQFLYESGLVGSAGLDSDWSIKDEITAVVSLAGEDVQFGSYPRGANLKGANSSNMDLSGINLSKTDLEGADLRNAGLWCANLSMANLTNAKLNGARLHGATLANARLTNADLTGAYMQKARFEGTHGVTLTALEKPQRG